MYAVYCAKYLMRKFLFTIAILIVCSFEANAQSKLGEVASVYFTSSNPDSSVAFYQKLGFTLIASNEFPVSWRQLSDGSLLLMMRKDTIPYIGLTYYTTDLENRVARLENDGIVFTGKPGPTDILKRYFIQSPDGFSVMMVNNLGNFKQPTGLTLLNMPQGDFSNESKFPNRLCGAFGEYAHPVADLQKSITFWKKLGFEVKANMKEPYPHAILSDGLMIIGLHETKHFNYPAVTYFGINVEQRARQLKDKGVINSKESTSNNLVVPTWEGNHFFIFSLGM